jgi:hypothetical protein
MKATKTFKIGEYCKGGIIQVQIKGKTILVIGREWDHSSGRRSKQNGHNNPEWTRITIEADNENAWRVIDAFLHELTTSYYAGTIMKWIESKIKLTI